MESKAKINEIFTSIQGEGPYIGVKQLFIRFCGCNLSCEYCDTNVREGADSFELAPQELVEHLTQFDLKTIHSISLTGGEPLLWAEYLTEFLPLLKKVSTAKIYLETNSTLNYELEKIIDNIDIISADIKLPSVSGVENSFAIHDEFFRVAKKYNKDMFVKIVFDENILDNEISNCLKLAEKYNLQLILQPKMQGNNLAVSSEKILEIFNKFLVNHPNTKVIPQVHKFLGVI